MDDWLLRLVLAIVVAFNTATWWELRQQRKQRRG